MYIYTYMYAGRFRQQSFTASKNKHAIQCKPDESIKLVKQIMNKMQFCKKYFVKETSTLICSTGQIVHQKI